MKIAPIIREMKKYKNIQQVLVHTGQHYDEKMSANFFEELDIPKPDYNLGVGSDSHAVQTTKIMVEFEKICQKEKPDLVIVVGDVNSTIACALVAKKMHIRVAHVEAGLRSFDRDMPEEINRVLTDAITDYFFVSEESGMKHLANEGKTENVYHVGNVMIDTLHYNMDKIDKTKMPEGIKVKEYAVITLHRPSNVDNKEILQSMLECFDNITKSIKLVWPLHPRTKKNIEKFELEKYLDNENIIILEPLDYLGFNKLVKNAKFILTDSGGIQEETTYMGVPCITLRENTERPSTVELGTNTIVGTDTKKILNVVKDILEGKSKKGSIPKYWDGKAAKRIMRIISEHEN